MGKNKKVETSYVAEFFIDSVGRRRKLSAGAMEDIRRDFRDGKSGKKLSEEWGVSVSLILSVCYNTPRQRDLDRLGLDAE